MKLRILRWLLAIGAWTFCVNKFADVLRGSGGYAGVLPLLFGFGAFLLGILLVSPEVVVPVAERVGEFLVGIIYPGSRLDKPPLSYVLAHRYRDQMRSAEAIAEYEKIIHYYPNERAAYEELLDLAEAAGDTRALRKYRRLYERRFEVALPPPAT